MSTIRCFATATTMSRTLWRITLVWSTGRLCMTPLMYFPSPFLGNVGATIGTQTLVQAEQWNYRDPYVQQWNLTVERQVVRDTGVRVSYNGSMATNLSTTIDQNQVPANTVGYNVA